MLSEQDQAYLDLREDILRAPTRRTTRPWGWKVNHVCQCSGEGAALFRIADVRGSVAYLVQASRRLPGASGGWEEIDKLRPVADGTWQRIDAARRGKLGFVDDHPALLPSVAEVERALPALVDAVHEMWLRWESEPGSTMAVVGVEAAVGERAADALREALGAGVRALPVPSAPFDSFGAPCEPGCGVVVATREGVLDIAIPRAAFIDPAPLRGQEPQARPAATFTLTPAAVRCALVSDNPAEVWEVSAYTGSDGWRDTELDFAQAAAAGPGVCGR